MDMNQYLSVFIDESKEHLQAINEHLLELEKNPNDLAIVNEIFRSAHTMKGMAGTMGYEDLSKLTHRMENVLDGIRNQKIQVTVELFDVAFKAADDLEAMVNSIAEGGDGKRDVSAVVQQLQMIEEGKSPKTGKVAVAKEMANDEGYNEYEVAVLVQSSEQGLYPYEIKVTLRKDCMLKAARVYMVFEILEQIGDVIKSVPSSEMLESEKFEHSFVVTITSREGAESIQKRVMKVSEIDTVEVIDIDVDVFKEKIVETTVVAEQMSQKEEIQEIVLGNNDAQAPVDAPTEQPSAPKAAAGNKTIRVNIERLDILMNLFEELVIDRGRLEQISHELNNSELHETVERMSRITGDLQSIILNMRMVPIETVFNRFPRLVRQLSRDLGKKINLEIVGAETELDRTVIDEIGDPLIHLIRNSLDHGVESPEIRRAYGKNEVGVIRLKAYHSGNSVFIEIEDDGAGINRKKVVQIAINRGVVSQQTAQSLTDKQICELIFAPGFSTADKISDISGRGVGLDVVKNTIESLGGSVEVESQEGKGSLFSIQLPLTLSIISVMLVEIQREKFAIPLSSIIETAIIKREDILHAHNQKVMDFRGKVVPLLFLREIFDVPVYEEDDEYLSVVIVRKGEKMAGLVVESFIGQQEVVLKALGDYLGQVFAISGATILGDGQVALIVDCNALIK